MGGQTTVGLPSIAKNLAKPGAVGNLAGLHVLRLTIGHIEALLAAKFATKGDKMIEYELAAISNR